MPRTLHAWRDHGAHLRWCVGGDDRALSDGTVDADRLTQLDVKFSKNFRLKRVNITPTFEAFNLFNASTVITYGSQSYATAAGTYRRPNSILQGRIIGVGTRVRW